jgi:hypothetical protein
MSIQSRSYELCEKNMLDMRVLQYTSLKKETNIFLLSDCETQECETEITQ